MAGSFQTDILPLFTPADIQHMKGMGVRLNQYAWMSNPGGDSKYTDHANANHVYARLAGTSEGDQMPLGGPYWTADQLKKLSDWMNVRQPINRDASRHARAARAQPANRQPAGRSRLAGGPPRRR